MALNQLFQGIGAGQQDGALMDTLAAMDLQELQKYANEHKGDAATVALALSVANIKKRAKAAEQVQPVNPNQPKVVDQAIAGIAPQPAPQAAPQQMAQGLPEDSGIAQIPAPNMQKMAGGGIVAFEEGGEVVRMFEGGVPPRPVQRIPGDPAAALWDSKYGAMYNVNGTPKQAPMAPEYVRNPETKTYEKNPVRAEQDMAKFEKASDTYMADREAKEMAAFDKAGEEYMAQRESGAGATDTPGTKNTAGAGAGGQGAPLPGFPSVNSFANQVMGIDKLLPEKEKAQEREKFMAEREDVSKPVWAKAESMINKEKDRLSEGKEQDFYMALIEGGLAAAAGEGPNALQNIAKGFSQGAKSYSSALKDFRKASQENSKMEMDIERAKAAEKRGDMDAYQKYEDSIKNRNADIDKLKTSGIFALQNVHTSGQYQQQAAATNAAAHIKAAGMPGAQERLFATLGGGDVVKGLEKFQAAQTDKTGAAYAKLYSDYAANADKSGMDKMSPVEFAQNMQQFMGAMQGGGFQKDPTNSTVRTLPPAK